MSSEISKPHKPPTDPIDHLRDAILSQWSPQLELIELHGEGDEQTLLVVADRPNDSLQIALADKIQEHFPEHTPRLQLLDTKACATIQL